MLLADRQYMTIRREATADCLKSMCFDGLNSSNSHSEAPYVALEALPLYEVGASRCTCFHINLVNAIYL